jgi:hypothetical protein
MNPFVHTWQQVRCALPIPLRGSVCPHATRVGDQDPTVGERGAGPLREQPHQRRSHGGSKSVCSPSPTSAPPCFAMNAQIPLCEGFHVAYLVCHNSIRGKCDTAFTSITPPAPLTRSHTDQHYHHYPPPPPPPPRSGTLLLSTSFWNQTLQP